MLVLTLRTDKAEAEIGLYKNPEELEYVTWLAHYELAETIYGKVKSIMKKNGVDWKDLDGIICFKGPGSFTGLRIGLSLGNALSYSLKIPIVATTGNNWIKTGLAQLKQKKDIEFVMPYYGGKINITIPKK